MKPTVAGRAAIIFEMAALHDSNQPISNLSSWSGTYAERFSPVHDSVPILMEGWKCDWDVAAMSATLLSATWDSFPERSAQTTDSAPFVTVAETIEEAAKAAFASARGIVWVVTIDRTARYRVWRHSVHPSYGPDGLRTVVDFSRVPAHTSELGAWLMGMDETTTAVADRLQSTARYYVHSFAEILGIAEADGGKEGNNG